MHPNAGARAARAAAECGTAVRARACIRRLGARPSRLWPGDGAPVVQLRECGRGRGVGSGSPPGGWVDCRSAPSVDMSCVTRGPCHPLPHWGCIGSTPTPSSEGPED
eukprot:3332567-Pleurochrysis_carterae.AAC.2